MFSAILDGLVFKLKLIFFPLSVKNKTKYLLLLYYVSVRFHTRNKNDFKANKLIRGLGYFGHCAYENFLGNIENTSHEYLERAVFISLQCIFFIPSTLINNR